MTVHDKQPYYVAFGVHNDDYLRMRWFETVEEAEIFYMTQRFRSEISWVEKPRNVHTMLEDVTFDD